VNAAHLHQTKVIGNGCHQTNINCNIYILGTFITEWDAGAAIWIRILSDSDMIDKVAQQLAKIAEKYNFDGW
jgi:hypothetical protein